MRDDEQTREDRATQPMDCWRLSLAICPKVDKQSEHMKESHQSSSSNRKSQTLTQNPTEAM